VARLAGTTEQIGVKPAGVAAPARRRCHNDTVDIDEPPITPPKPQVIRAVVGSALIEGQQEGFHLADPAGVKCLLEQHRQSIVLEPRQLHGMCIVEREDSGLDHGRDR
jgi:hypothetical protein